MKLKQKYIQAIAQRIHPRAKMKCLNKISLENLKMIDYAFTELEQKIKDLEKVEEAEEEG